MPPLAKRKEEEHEEDEDQDAGGQGKGRRKKLRKGKTKDQENEGTAQQGGGKKTMDINQIIKAKVTPVLPEFLDIKKLCALCNIEHKNLFGSTICSFAALKGVCPFWKCRSSHDSSKVTDEVAEKVVNLLEPFLRNPAQLTEG